MAVLTDIKSADWQVSLLGAGSIEEGLNDIRQCLDVILRTKKGSDPLRPQFGSDIFKHIDSPVNIAVPNMKLAILEACEIWEKRIEIVSITHIIDNSQIQFFVTYSLVDDGTQDNIQLLINGGGVLVSSATAASLIIEGIFPPGYVGYLLKVLFTLDGVLASPAPPVYGFTNPYQFWLWAKTNWGTYGTWYLLTDRVILFMKPGIASSGSILISVNPALRFAHAIPNTLPGEHLTIKYELGGTHLSPGLLTIADLLTWCIANIPGGYWTIENTIPTVSDFSDDFSDDFGTDLSYELVIYTETFTADFFEVLAL